MKKARKTKPKLETKRPARNQAKKPDRLSTDVLKAKPATQEIALRQIEKRIAAGDKLTKSELKIYYELEKRSNPEAIGGVKAAAKYSGMSARVIRYANGKGELRANPDGTFNKAELDRWLSTRDGRKKPIEEAAMSSQEKKGKANYWEAKGKKEALLYKKIKGLLVEWSEVEDQWVARLTELTSGLGGFADRLSGLLAGKARDEMHSILDSEVRTLMENYSRAGKFTPEMEAKQ